MALRRKKNVPPPTPSPSPDPADRPRRKVVGRLNTWLLIIALVILAYILTDQYGCMFTSREDTLEWTD